MGAGATMAMEAGTAMAMDAGTAMAMDAGTAMAMDAGTAMPMDADTAMKVHGGGMPRRAPWSEEDEDSEGSDGDNDDEDEEDEEEFGEEDDDEEVVIDNNEEDGEDVEGDEAEHAAKLVITWLRLHPAMVEHRSYIDEYLPQTRGTIAAIKRAQPTLSWREAASMVQTLIIDMQAHACGARAARGST